MKTSPFLFHVITELEKVTGELVKVKSVHPEYGGSINDSYRLETNIGDFFLKRNNAENFPGMFEKEASGLRRLKASNSIHVPDVLCTGEYHGEAFLVLKYIKKANPVPDFWQKFGENLALMHKCTESYFGLEEDNYMGSLKQANTQKDRWTDFFIAERLVPQVSMANSAGKINTAMVKRFETLFYKIEKIFPEELPSLLHGDLWSGNFTCNEEGLPSVFDPAVYYGHREMDLAMTKLFGGFNSEMYKAYNNVFPLESGWKDRLDLCNLYPLLVHVNLFGGNYVIQVDLILRNYE